MNLRNDPLCTFCSAEVEDITHLLWDCPFVKKFYDEVTAFFSNAGVDIPFCKKFVLLGPYKEDIRSFIFLYLKYYIYLAKCTNRPLQIRHFLSYFKYIWQMYCFAFHNLQTRNLFESLPESVLEMFNSLFKDM